MLPTGTILCLCEEIMQCTYCIYYPFACPFIMHSFLSSCQWFFHYFMCVHPPCNSLLPWFGSQRDSFLQIIAEVCIYLRIKPLPNMQIANRCQDVLLFPRIRERFPVQQWKIITHTQKSVICWQKLQFECHQTYLMPFPSQPLSHDCCSGFYFQINIWRLYPKRQTNMQRKFCLCERSYSKFCG